MKKFWPKISLIAILALAFILRIVALGDFPAGFTADEAAQGYTAYSLLKTGKDEWGVSWPLNPRSFGDFKPLLYTYLTIPSVALLGLNEFAVRLPAVIFGTLAVWATFLLVQELFKGPLSLLTALLLAISPWHVMLSRGAFEANLTTFFLPLGFWLFLKGLERKDFFALAGFVFGLNLFTYHAAKLVTPLFLLFLCFWQRKKLLKKKDELVWGGIVFLIFVGLLFYSTLKGGGTRMADIGIFGAGFGAIKAFIDNYLSYFSPQFLFTQGPREATYGMIPGRGVLYLFELPFLILAVFFLIKKRKPNFIPILVWLLLASIPAALASGVGYHANRVAIMMPAIQMLSAYGLVKWLESIKKGRRLVILGIGVMVFISFSSFLWDYFYQAPKKMAPQMNYGWREAAAFLRGKEGDYEEIIISRKFSEPQAYIMFYQKYEPSEVQQTSIDWLRYEKEGHVFLDQLGEYSLGKYTFRNLYWPADKNLKKVLLLGKMDEFPPEVKKIKIIPYPDGERAFVIVDPEQ